PPDGFLKTTWGVYPAGGKFDDSSFEGLGLGDGAGGNGVTPMLLASSVDFLIAEAAMIENDPAAAKTAILNGLSKSVAKVMSFGAKDPGYDASFAPSAADITAHSNAIASAFDADATGGWNVLANEFFASLFGNGIDAYNFYRRTGYPTTLQPSLEPNPGGFMRSIFYPANFANNNKNVQQKAEVTEQVFWDNNPASPAFPVAN
ncbi:MAG: SusD/RagB family nutrient-binding outer membrane lipoprotein, partial [Flavobacteriaceae bacterium]